MNKAIFTVMLMLSFSLTGCIEDDVSDLQPENTLEPTGASDLDSLERRINELENETEELRYDNDKLGNRIIDLESANSELMNSYEQLISDFDNLTSEINSLNVELAELENRSNVDSELLERIALLEQIIADLEEDVEELMFDKSLLFNKLYLIRDIYPGNVQFSDEYCTIGCSAITRNMFNSGYMQTSSEIGVHENYILFGAKNENNIHHNSAPTLWISDGSGFGTFEISKFTDPGEFMSVQTGVFFTAFEWGTGNGRDDYGNEIFFTDGSAQGTVRVTNDNRACEGDVYKIYGVSGNSIFVGSNVYDSYSCASGSDGERLYRITALDNGEFEIVSLDFNNLYNVRYNNYVVLEDKLFFTSSNYDDNTIGLYYAGFQNITLINEYSDNARFGKFGVANGSVYFGFGDFGNESLWKTDGTEAGTFRFKTFQNNSLDNVYITSMSTDVTRDLIYFEVALIGEDGNRSDNIYISDGTTDGTYSVIEGTGQETYRFFQDEINGDVLFVADRYIDDDLHFYHFNESNYSFEFKFNSTIDNYLNFYDSIFVGGAIYMIGSNNLFGEELWKIDMDREHIGILHDINPGTSQSGIDSLVYFEGKVFFSAYSPTYGGEFWYITV